MGGNERHVNGSFRKLPSRCRKRLARFRALPGGFFQCPEPGAVLFGHVKRCPGATVQGEEDPESDLSPEEKLEALRAAQQNTEKAL